MNINTSAGRLAADIYDFSIRVERDAISARLTLVSLAVTTCQCKESD